MQQLGNSTSVGRNPFVAAQLRAPSIRQLTTLDIFHDCSRIAFYWAANEVGSGVEEIKGMDLLYMTGDNSQINMAMVEFNSLAWAKDIGWKIQKDDGAQY
jgi:hypothetical protein